MSINPRNVDEMLNQSEPTEGVLTDFPLNPLTDFTLETGLHFAASGAGIVGAGAIMTSFIGLIWNATATTTDFMYLTRSTPGNFREPSSANRIPGTSHWSEFQLQVLARKLDTTGSATENATLAMNATMNWLYSDPNDNTDPGDTALNSLTTPAAALLDAKYGAAAEEGFKWYTFDLGARLQAESKRLRPNSAFQIIMSVSAAVGAALAIEMIGARLRYRVHAAMVNRDDRRRTTLMGSLTTGLTGTAQAGVSNV